MAYFSRDSKVKNPACFINSRKQAVHCAMVGRNASRNWRKTPLAMRVRRTRVCPTFHYRAANARGKTTRCFHHFSCHNFHCRSRGFIPAHKIRARINNLWRKSKPLAVLISQRAVYIKSEGSFLITAPINIKPLRKLYSIVIYARKRRVFYGAKIIYEEDYCLFLVVERF
jgi:hypothetical protein